MQLAKEHQMPAKAKRSEGRSTRPTSITAVVDPVAALASRSLSGNVYLYDTNKKQGSTGFGTEELRTQVRKGDEILWNVVPLECETFVSIDGIEMDKQVCVPEKHVYPGTDISYWSGTVLKDIQGAVHYQLNFRLGTLDTPIPASASPALVG
jgi:hypothetical protein